MPLRPMRPICIPHEVRHSDAQGKDGTSPYSRVDVNRQTPAATLSVTPDVAVTSSAEMEILRAKNSADETKKLDQSPGF